MGITAVIAAPGKMPRRSSERVKKLRCFKGIEFFTMKCEIFLFSVDKDKSFGVEKHTQLQAKHLKGWDAKLSDLKSLLDSRAEEKGL
jgi:hypothetical protein